MAHRHQSGRRFRPARVVCIALVALIATTFGLAPGGVRAASLQPAMPASNCTTSVTTGPAAATDWIGGDMVITLTGETCHQVYYGSIDYQGNLTLPAAMESDTYLLTGSATVNGHAGNCVIWSILCFIVPGATFSIDDNGNYTISGFIFCQGFVQFTGVGSFPISYGDGFGGSGGGTATATPELSSGALAATGLVPMLGALLFLRRRRGRAGEAPDDTDG
jgi:hypothetical protein